MRILTPLVIAIVTITSFALISSAQAQTTDSFTATGTGVFSGSWDTSSNWSTGTVPTSSQDAQFVNNFAYANYIASGSGTINFTVTGGADVANSLWLTPPTYSGIPPNVFSLGYSFQNTLTVNGSGTVNGYSGYAWDIVNEDNPTNGGANTGYNTATFTNPLTFNNTHIAIAGTVDANFAAANAGSSLLVTGQPSFLGGQIAPQSGNPAFASSVVTVEGLTNISTIEVTVNGGNSASAFLLGEAGLNFTSNALNATPSGTGGFGTNIILNGGGLRNSTFTSFTMGTLTLGAGTNYVNGGANGDGFVFNSLTGLTNSTPVSGTILAVTVNASGDSALGITGNSTANNINGIAGGWAIVLPNNNAGADWATWGNDGSLNPLTGVDTAHTGAGYTYDEGTPGLGDGGQNVTAANWTSAENIDIGTSITGTNTANVVLPAINDSLTKDTTINSLRFGVASSVASLSNNISSTPPTFYYYLDGATLDLQGHQLVINTGGIIASNGPNFTTTSPFTIQDSVGGAGITAGAGSNYNLYLFPGTGGINGSAGANIAQQGGNASPSLMIAAPIVDNGANPVSVTVSSSNSSGGSNGNVYLYGANTYTGNTYLVSSAAAIDADSGLGADGNQVVFNGGTLNINAPISSFGHQIVLAGGNGGTITIQPIGLNDGSPFGYFVSLDHPDSGLVLSNQDGAPAITGNGPLTFQSDTGVGDGMISLDGTNPGNAHIVEMDGSSALTGPLSIQNGTFGGPPMDFFLNNTTGSGYALNSDTYLNPSHGNVNLVWLASNQVNPTAVIDVSNVATGSFSNANMQLSGFSDTIGGLIETDSGNGNFPGGNVGVGLLQSNGDNGISNLTINTQYRSDVNNGVYIYTGQISGQTGGGADNSGVINIVKTGPATQVFSGPNSYTGTTTVEAGALIVQNDASGPTGVTNGGNYTISGGSDPSNTFSATFGGYGTVLTQGSNGTFTAQGTDPDHLGIIYPGTAGLSPLTSSNNVLYLGYSNKTTAPIANQTSVAFNPFSELKLDINSGSYTTAQSQTFSLSSVLAVNGNVTIDPDSTLDLNFLNGTVPTGTYLLLTTDGGSGTTGSNPFTGDALGTITGTFDTVINLPSNYQIDYSVSGEILLDVVSVPEPSTYVLVGLGLVFLMAGHRFRRASSVQ